jgi:flagellar hook-length control protein FliK
MPKIADNFFSTNTASLSTSSRRSNSNQQNDGGDLFQKILNQSRPKSEESVEAPRKQSHTEKQNTRTRADAANRRKKSSDDENDPVDRADDADQTNADPPATDASTELDPSADEQTEAAPKAAESKPTDDSDQSEDAAQLAAATAAADQQPRQQDAKVSSDQQPDSAPQPLTKVESKPLVKPLASQPVKTDDDQAKDPGPIGEHVSDADIDAMSTQSAGGDQQESEEDPEQALPKDPAVQKIAAQPVARPRQVAGLGDTQPVAVKATDHSDTHAPDSSVQPAADAMAAMNALSQFADAAADSSESRPPASSPAKVSGADSDVDRLTQLAQPATNHKTDSTVPVKPATTPPAPARPEAEFAETNHDRIVTSLRSQLLPNGGTMHMRLDPPELGVLQVTVRMQDGAMTASFETSNDQATKLLSHSLGQLKTVLESQGVSVEKLHVQQTPKDQQASSNGEDRQHQHAQQDGQSSTRQEQQRREMLRRMWRRLGIGHDPLDMVA